MYVEKEEKDYHMEKCQRIGYMKDMSPASAFFIYVIYSQMAEMFIVDSK